MEFTPQEQFEGFLATSQIFAENILFEYPLYQTSNQAPEGKLPEVTAPSATVLGKRMEHFFACYISCFTSEEILAQNRQIIRNKETLGELDFLLKDTASKDVSHVEMIFKFYLFDPDTGTSELDHLIGPNKRDSLNRKLDRLHKRQFPLLFQDATKEFLSTLNVDADHVTQKMCFKASVFLPKHFKTFSFEKLNPETVAGSWIRASEFTFEAYGKNSFFTPKKKYWPVLPERNKTWFSFEDIREQIQPLLENKFAPLLWMKTPEGNHERMFVVWW